jgi:tetratricopeptide (TPR) repeat protein
MQNTQKSRTPSARTQQRLIVGMIMILVIGIPLVGALYFFDQYRDPGPSLADRAVLSAEDAVQKNPNAISPRFTLAELYAAKGRYQEAITQYDEILKAQPDTAAVLLGRGRAYVALDNLDAAAADFQKVIDGATDKEMSNYDQQLEGAYYNLGNVELKRDHPKVAAELLAKAVLINRTDADALYLLGTAMVKSGDPKSGIDALHLAIALVPTGWCDPYAGLGDAYTAQKDSAGAQYANGMVALCEKRYTEAQTQLKAASSGTHALEAFIGLGLLAEEQGDYTAAADAYNKALARDPQNFAATTGLGRVGGASQVPASQAPASPASQAPASPAPSASAGS